MASAYRNCLITGASSGIGRALALRIARDGVEVIACARREAELESLAQEITGAGGKARVQVMDVADTTRSVEIIRKLDEELGGLDLVIANAGMGQRGEKGVDLHTWEQLHDPCHVNFTGAVATLTAVLPQMKARGRGHVVGVSSLASFGALKASAPYCAPKAGLSMFLDCLRLDLANSGVAVTTIHPGFVRRPMTAKARHPMPQLVEVDDAAELIWRRLQKRPARIDFPQPFAWFVRIMGGLPRAVRELFVRMAPGARG